MHVYGDHNSSSPNFMGSQAFTILKKSKHRFKRAYAQGKEEARCLGGRASSLSTPKAGPDDPPGTQQNLKSMKYEDIESVRGRYLMSPVVPGDMSDHKTLSPS